MVKKFSEEQAVQIAHDLYMRSYGDDFADEEALAKWDMTVEPEWNDMIQALLEARFNCVYHRNLWNGDTCLLNDCSYLVWIGEVSSDDIQLIGYDSGIALVAMMFDEMGDIANEGFVSVGHGSALFISESARWFLADMTVLNIENSDIYAHFDNLRPVGDDGVNIEEFSWWYAAPSDFTTKNFGM